MLTYTFKSKTGNLEVTAKLKDSDIDREDFESSVRCMVQHLSSHFNTYKTPEIFHQITRMRTKFLNDVLKFLVEFTQACGGTIPPKIRKHLTKGVKPGWELGEDEES